MDWRACALESDLPLELLSNSYWLPTNDVMKFLHRLELKYGDKVTRGVGQGVTLSTLSPHLETRAASVESLAEAITVLIDELSHLSNHVSVWAEYKDDSWWLCHRSCYRPVNLGFEPAEWFRTLALVKFCQVLEGNDWNPERVKLVSNNSNNRDLPLSSTDITFGCEYGAIKLALDDAYVPIPIHTAEPDWFESIQKLILSYAFLPWFNIEWFAQLIGMTKRTLQRHLKTQGLVFKQMKEETRLSKAKELLKYTNWPVSEISWQVGYTDLSNFNRSFKKKTGMTAPCYRRARLPD